jgi:Icc-related predicted phosphoesterase
LRIAVIGDFHIKVEELELSERAMKDINQAKPDLVVALGDFGCHKQIGHISGMKQSFDLLALTGARVRPILGNHDLQRESGKGPQAKGTMEAEMKKLYHLDSAYSVEEYPGFRLFFLSGDPQPESSCYQIQECYISDQQFGWFTEKLAERPGVPAIIFTHAPPLGTGLRTVPDVHIRATNAYLDQNHDPYRWKKLLYSYPQISLWFSAHYHLSHDYSDSHSVVGYTIFFTTGVHGSASRDGGRQSRIIDILEDGVKVSTIDHRLGSLRKEPDWQKHGAIGSWDQSSMQQKDEGSEVWDIVEGSGKVDSKGCSIGSKGCSKYAEVRVGIQGNGFNQIVVVDETRCYVASEEGYLWETEPVHRSVMGTLHKGSPVTGAIEAGGEIWWASGNRISAASLKDPWRFTRQRGSEEPTLPAVWEMPEGHTVFGKGTGKEVWAACKGMLVRMDSAAAPTSYSIPADIGKPVKLVMANPTALWILSEAGALWEYSITNGHAEYVSDGWLDWDSEIDSMAGIADGENPVIHWWTEGKVWSIDANQLVNGSQPLFSETAKGDRILDMNKGSVELKSARKDYDVACLNEGALLVRIRGIVYFFRKASAVAVQIAAEGTAAIGKASSQSGLDIFALYKQPGNPHDHPLLEMWTMAKSPASHLIKTL